MPDARVTIVVVPREQFNQAPVSLERIYTTTGVPFDLVYVDGNSPPPLRRYLARQAEARGFAVIRTEHYLTSNEARNIGLRHVRTPYVAFVDNDVLPEPAWLDALLGCADETGAWAVGPVVHVGHDDERMVHGAGAAIRIVEAMGARRLSYTPRLSNVPLASAGVLERARCDLIKFYAMLVRRDVFDRIGSFDEAIRSILEPADFALAVQRAGGIVYLEPSAVVTHTLPPPLPLSDVPFFLLRWSNAWLRASIRHFAQKHDLPLGDPGLRNQYRWRSFHRRRVLPPALWTLLGARPLKYPAKAVDRVLFDGLLEHMVVPRLERQRAAGGLGRS